MSKIILAVGLSVALQRLVAIRTFGFERLVRHTMIGMVLLVLVLTVAIGSHRYFHERKIVSALPDSPPSVPNVLLIVLDTVRAESMSLYGYEHLTTPYLKDLAGEGVVFQNAIATSSWTLPSHASFFTGRFDYENPTSFYNPLDTTYPTLAEVLSKRGYVTGGFVANNTYCRVEHGLARGFSHYEDNVPSVREFARSSSLIRYALDGPVNVKWLRRFLGYYEPLDSKPASWITNDFLRWVDHVPGERPFFAFLNYFDAHRPYLCPEDFACRFGSTNQLYKFLGRPWPKCLFASSTPAEEIDSVRNAYDGCIAYIDDNLKRLFGELKQRDIFDRTLLVIVSDHGEEFGEHNTNGHANDLHIQSIRVPLILRLPDIVPTEVTVQEPVTIRDIPATVIGLLGLPDEGLFPGRSLGRYWIKSERERQETFDPVLSELQKQSWKVGTTVEKGEMKSLIIGDMHYIRNGDGSEEVYDLRNDPYEHNDLIQTPRGAETAAQVRDVLKQMIP
ncbi:MAG: sulfatase [Planctomycetes bacterium]|nr:sulfatase [Planctomycetota bacterium]